MGARPYQLALKQDIYSAWSLGAKNVLAVLPTGGGKTFVFSEVLLEHVGASCAIAHRQELVSQISLALARNKIRHRIIGPKSVVKLCVNLHMQELKASYYDPSAVCAVAGIDTLVRRADELAGWLNSVTLWVQDECFPAGTMVGDKHIEDIKVGDTVSAFNENTGAFEDRRVNRLYKNPAPKHMVRITLRHHVLYCTLNHPIWTDKGWVNAGELTKQHKVYMVQDQRGEPSGSPKEAIRSNWARVLLERVLRRVPCQSVVRNDEPYKPQTRIREDEKKQPYEKRNFSRQDVCDFKSDRASTEGTGREWETTYLRGVKIVKDLWGSWLLVTNGSEYGAPCGYLRVSTLLQDRLWPSFIKDWYRSRRVQPHESISESPGPKERQVFNWVRVDDISIQERADITDPRGSCTDGHVYNFEVDGLHTYTANGIVVHNCHHVLEANKWGTGASMFPNAKGLGVTATPLRADGKGLGREYDGLFDTMVVGPGMRDLITAGYLTEYRVFAPPNDIDLTAVSVSKTTGDYSRDKLVKAVRKSHVVGDVVDHYLRIARGKLGITFATDVQTATDIAAQFNAQGVPAEVVSAKTPDAERVAVLRRFKRRELLQLVNVDLFGEGFDLPAIEVVSMARPTQSYGLYVQVFGRGLRIMRGKTEAIIIDHVGNVVRHGLPDAPREWSLGRREKRGKSEASDEIPVKACPQCTAVYERVYKECPFCGFKPLPMARSGPEQVDGDLTELDAETLAKMRGDVNRVDMSGAEYRAELAAKHVPVIGQMAGVNRHAANQEAQKALRDVIAWWAGYQRGLGRSDDESYRRFFFMFGVDVLTCQAYSKKEADVLSEKIGKKIMEVYS